MAKGGGKSGGSGGGSSKPSGGGQSSGGSKPSGGGSKPSGGGQSSGGGNKPQGGGQAKSVATPTASVTSKSNKTPTPTFIPANKPSGGSGSSGNKKQDRIQNLTKQANQLISSASGGAIADPGKFKEVLSKLKKLGKDDRVEALREKKQKAVASTKVQNGGNNQVTPGLTQGDLDSAIQNAFANYTPGGLTQEDLDAALAGLDFGNKGELGESYGGGDSGGGGGGSSWEQGYTNDLNKWLSEYQNEQAGRATDYQSMLTDIASQEGQFDPNLFRSLLGELESSKKRQKEWNERSARAAYKY